MSETTAQTQPSEEELRAAYEAELSRITTAEVVVQTAASLLNLGARRLGLTGAGESERDLEQVRDAIDGVRALMPILERRLAQPSELRALRDALSQLQMAYAREAPRAAGDGAARSSADAPAPGQPPAGQAPPGQPSAAEPPAGQAQPGKPGPGPAESSGRLWVPGR
jgi:hypothetical protein